MELTGVLFCVQGLSLLAEQLQACAMPASFKNILKGCLAVNSHQRPSIDAVLTALQQNADRMAFIVRRRNGHAQAAPAHRGQRWLCRSMRVLQVMSCIAIPCSILRALQGRVRRREKKRSRYVTYHIGRRKVTVLL